MRSLKQRFIALFLVMASFFIALKDMIWNERNQKNDPVKS
jgi:hypothetical protein